MGAMTGDPECHPLGLPYPVALQLSEPNKLFTTVALNQIYTFTNTHEVFCSHLLNKRKETGFHFCENIK